MLKRTKIRIGIGSVAACALVAGALTTAFAEGHGSGSSNSSYSSSSSSWNPNIATSTTTIRNISSTVPSTGDVNPYGVATIPSSIGHLTAGYELVTNYNNKSNLNGTGASIMQINPATGQKWLFAWLTQSSLPSPCPGGIGLNSSLVVLKNGWVIVSSLPTSDGTSKTAKSGCLIVINSLGHAKVVLSGGWLQGGWGMTAVDNGNNVQLFVTSVLNGTAGHWNQVRNTATVIRINLSVTRQTFRVRTIVIIASGLPTKLSTAGFIQSVTGLVVVGNRLFIVDTLNSRILFVNWATSRFSSAGTGFTLTRGGLLSSPLIIIAFHGTLLVTNSGNGNLIAISLSGRTSLVKALDTTAASGSSPGADALWGMAPSLNGQWIYYANDLSNTLNAVGPLQSS
jgi:hypothetical protein